MALGDPNDPALRQRIRQYLAEGLDPKQVADRIRSEERSLPQKAAGVAAQVTPFAWKTLAGAVRHPIQTARQAISGVAQSGMAMIRGIPEVAGEIAETVGAPRTASRLRGYSEQLGNVQGQLLEEAGAPEGPAETVGFLGGYVAPYIAAGAAGGSSLPSQLATGAAADFLGAASAPENSFAGMVAPESEFAQSPTLRGLADVGFGLGIAGALPAAAKAGQALRGMGEAGAAVSPVSRGTPRVPGQVETGMGGRWFSRLERAIEQAPQERATGQQWLGMIKGAPGGQYGKELEWTGIEKWLADRADTSISRADVLSAARQEGIRLSEREFGGAGAREAKLAYDEFNADYTQQRERLMRQISDRTSLTPTEAYQFYVLPVRTKRLDPHDAALQIRKDAGPGMMDDEVEEFARALREHQELYDEGQRLRFAMQAQPQANEEYARYTIGQMGTRPDANYREIEIAVEPRKGERAYTGSHLKTPGSMGHLRVSDTTIDGEKALVVHEFQSDRVREGRELGYAARTSEAAVLNESAGGASAHPYGRGVPDTPYKSPEEWVGLLFRRALQEAAQGGYSRVVWANGDQVADMYDLRKQVSRITYDTREQQLLAFDLEGEEVINRRVPPEELPGVIGKGPAERLLSQAPSSPTGRDARRAYEDYLKSMGRGPYTSDQKAMMAALNTVSNRMISSRMSLDDAIEEVVGARYYDAAQGNPSVAGSQFVPFPDDIADRLRETLKDIEPSHREIKDADLAIGGEWATNLYDKVALNIARKEAKRLGVQLEQVPVTSGTAEVVPYKLGDVQVYQVVERGGGARERLLFDRMSKEGAERAAAEHNAQRAGTNWSLRLTPEARDKILNEGQRIGAVPNLGVGASKVAEAGVGAAVGAGAAGGEEGGLTAGEGAAVGALAGITGIPALRSTLAGLPDVGRAAAQGEAGRLVAAVRNPKTGLTAIGATHPTILNEAWKRGVDLGEDAYALRGFVETETGEYIPRPPGLRAEDLPGFEREEFRVLGEGEARQAPSGFTITHEDVSEGVAGVFRQLPPDQRGALTDAVERSLSGGESGDLLVDLANQLGGTSMRVTARRGMGGYAGQRSPNVLLTLEGAERADVERVMALRGLLTGQDAEAAYRVTDDVVNTFEDADRLSTGDRYVGMELRGDVERISEALSRAGIDHTADLENATVVVVDYGHTGAQAMVARVAEAADEFVEEVYPHVFEGLYLPREGYARAAGGPEAFGELARLLDERVTPAYRDLANSAGFGAGDDLSRLERLSERLRQASAPPPGRGLYEKGPGSKKAPRPPRSEIDRRLSETEAKLDYLEATAQPTWKPASRGVFERGADPSFRRLEGINTMPEPRGKKRPGLTRALTHERIAAILDRQVKLGLPQGGEGFYNLEPIAQSIDGMNAPKNSFEDFAVAGGIGSIQNPIVRELSNASIFLYAKANGITVEQAVADYFRRYPGAPRPFLTGTQAKMWEQHVAEGRGLPTPSPTDGARKVPTYIRQKLGETGPTATIDTHEGRAVLGATGNERMIGNLTGAEYQQVADAVYVQGAERLGLAHSDQYQAGRWIGGGALTGLQSPRGDYVQHLEDALLYTALATGKDSSPAGLRRLWEDVVNGRDFLLTYYGKGSPVTEAGALVSDRNGFALNAAVRGLAGMSAGAAAGAAADDENPVRGALVGMAGGLGVGMLPEAISALVKMGANGHLVTPAKGSKQGLELGSWWADQTGLPLADWNAMTKAEQDNQIVQLARAERDLNLGGSGEVIGGNVRRASDVQGPGLPPTLEERRKANVLIPGMRLDEQGAVARPLLTGIAQAGVGATVGAAVAPEDQELLGAMSGGIAALVGGQLIKGEGHPLQRVMSWRKAGLLSSLSTTVMNVSSTGTMVGAEALKDAPAAAWDWMLSGMTGIRSKSGISLSTIRASFDAAGDGLEQAKQIWKDGQSAADLAKYDQARITFDNPVVQWMHDAVFNLLGAQDRFFHTMAFARSLQEQANVIAREAFAGRPSIAGMYARSPEFSTPAELASWLQRNPTADMALLAESDAALAVFRNQDGLLANAAKNLRQVFKDAGPVSEAVFDLFLPFTTTPANVVSRVAEYSPLGFLGATRDAVELRRMVQEGGDNLSGLFGKQREVANTLGRATLGTSVIALGYWLAQRNLLSPGYPQDDRERNIQRVTGRQPGSIRIGSRDYAIERLAPFGPLLVMGAELHAGARSGKGEAAWRAAGYLGRNVTNESFLGDIDGALGLLSGEQSLERNLAVAGSDMAASFVPNIVRRGLAGYDPTVREVRTPSLADPNTLLDRTRTALPGLRQDMPARVGTLGEQTTTPRSGVLGAAVHLFNPFTGAVDLADGDPLRAEIESVGASIPTPDTSVRNLGAQKGTKAYQLLMQQYGSYVRQALEHVQQGGMELTVAGERKYVSYSEATPEQRRTMLQETASRAKSAMTQSWNARLGR